MMNRYLIPSALCMVMHFTPAYADTVDPTRPTIRTKSAVQLIGEFASTEPFHCKKGRAADPTRIDFDRQCWVRFSPSIVATVMDEHDKITGVLLKVEIDRPGSRAEATQALNVLTRMIATAMDTDASEIEARAVAMDAELQRQLKANEARFKIDVGGFTLKNGVSDDGNVLIALTVH